MTNTTNLELPLVQAAQAQKHVTVNEALGLLDGLCQMTFESQTQTTPPLAVLDGALYAVPEGATGDWVAQTGQLALASNGGWRFVTPQVGWKGWIKDAGISVAFDGSDWQAGGVVVSGSGAATVGDIVEIDTDLTAGPAVEIAAAIPWGCVVIGITARVTDDITGAATSWRLGVPGSTDRYGSGLGLSLGSFAMGLTGQPQAYYSDTPVRLEAEGGDFAGGAVKLAIHLLRLVPPRE